MTNTSTTFCPKTKIRGFPIGHIAVSCEEQRQRNVTKETATPSKGLPDGPLPNFGLAFIKTLYNASTICPPFYIPDKLYLHLRPIKKYSVLSLLI